MFLFFFFFKQKTAYEMRISDWSSDVCSSDLALHRRQRLCGIERSPHLVLPCVDEARPGDDPAVRGFAGSDPEHAGGGPALRGGRAEAPADPPQPCRRPRGRSEEHTSELQSLMRSSFTVFCLTKQTQHQT